MERRSRSRSRSTFKLDEAAALLRDCQNGGDLLDRLGRKRMRASKKYERDLTGSLCPKVALQLTKARLLWAISKVPDNKLEITSKVLQQFRTGSNVAVLTELLTRALGDGHLRRMMMRPKFQWPEVSRSERTESRMKAYLNDILEDVLPAVACLNNRDLDEDENLAQQILDAHGDVRNAEEVRTHANKLIRDFKLFWVKHPPSGMEGLHDEAKNIYISSDLDDVKVKRTVLHEVLGHCKARTSCADMPWHESPKRFGEDSGYLLEALVYDAESDRVQPSRSEINDRLAHHSLKSFRDLMGLDELEEVGEVRGSGHCRSARPGRWIRRQHSPNNPRSP